MNAVFEERWFTKVLPQGHITEEMKEMPHCDLLEYCGQLYRRLDRIKAVLERARAEEIHTYESIMYAVGEKAYTEFEGRNVGYDKTGGEDD
jgi:hypothetical protein